MQSTDRIWSLASIAVGAFAAAIVSMPVWAGPGHTVAIVNSTRTSMVSLQVRPSGTSSWQPDVLNARPLGVQRQVSVGVPDSSKSCYYDVFARYEDGHRKIKNHVNLCQGSKVQLSDF